MKLTLKREFKGRNFTEGSLFINDKFECFTVEDRDRELESSGIKILNVTAIPKGVYPVVISMSKRFGKPLLEVQNVPGFTGVRIHSGNSSKDTEGCIIVGSINIKNDDDWVGGSRVAYEQLHTKVNAAIAAGQKITLEVI